MITTALLMLAAATSPTPDAPAFTTPEVIEFGASLEEMEERLAPLCETLNTRPIDPPFLPDVQDRQQQIDCDGFMYRGRPRWVEFVIRDGILVMVWLMVEDEERDGIIADMEATLGERSAENARYVAFEQARAAWRHEPAEILFYGPQLDEIVPPWFEAEE